ncbi:MAG: hypothetical protein NUV48_15510, partial [Peptococcaceae bacterium]|nr:hypothetical protein [Peptococcaceae bacterium]
RGGFHPSDGAAGGMMVYKAMIETAARSTTLWSLCYDNNSSMEKLDFYDQQKTERIYLEKQEQAKIRDIGWAFIDKEAAKDPFLKEVWDSAKAYYLKMVEYNNFMQPIPPSVTK